MSINDYEAATGSETLEEKLRRGDAAFTHLYRLVNGMKGLHAGGQTHCPVCCRIQESFGVALVDTTTCQPFQHEPDCAWKLAYKWLQSQKGKS